MKTMTAVFLTAFAALIFAACGAPPANNGAANTNTNTTKPAPAAPTADALLALDKSANDAYFKADAKYFEGFLSDKFGWSEKGKHMTKADVLKQIAGVKCDIKTWSIDEPLMSPIDADTAVLSYKGTFDGTCTENGKASKVPSPVRGATVFVRNGDKWQAAWHSETPIMEPKKDEKAADKTAVSDAKKPDAKAEPKKEEPKAEVKKEEPKKDEAKKEEPKKDDKTATSDATATTPEAKPDANTDALVKIELAGWEAWKNKDAKGLDSMAAKNLAVVDPAGGWHGNRADVLKSWDGSNCENVKTVNIKNGFAWALSPTVEILSFDATADGMCDGMKNGLMNGTSVYVKEGDTWKIAFGYLSPAGKM